MWLSYIEEYEKNKANLDSAGSSGGNPENAGGTMNVHGVGIESEQVFETCKCVEEDKVMFAASTFEGHALTWWNGNDWKQGSDFDSEGKTDIKATQSIKGNITSSKPATLHDAINMARELVEQAVQDKATRIGESNKKGASRVIEVSMWKSTKVQRCNFHIAIVVDASNVSEVPKNWSSGEGL
ncbi:hypothetical protein Tco_0483820 [Tanacetum coccineum]